MSEITNYPLYWPDGRTRTGLSGRRHGRFKTSFAAARHNLLAEIRRLGGKNVIISSNLPLRNDGLPYSTMKPSNGDPGIACYFDRKARGLCFACDCYLTVDDNMHAIALTISALRGIARWGTGDMMEAAFRGFAALPERTGSAWWEVLGVDAQASISDAKGAYLLLAKKHHPDVGGDAELFRRINEAYSQARQLLTNES